jgi:hypothetical protein
MDVAWLKDDIRAGFADALEAAVGVVFAVENGVGRLKGLVLRVDDDAGLKREKRGEFAFAGAGAGGAEVEGVVGV